MQLNRQGAGGVIRNSFPFLTLNFFAIFAPSRFDRFVAASEKVIEPPRR
jgi:hypothetical protein